MTTVLITGANRGIGLELARQARDRGDRVLGTARHPDQASELAKTAHEVFALDVGSAASVESFRGAIGQRAIDILINNAGVYGERDDLPDLDLEQVIQTFSVNAVGALRVTLALLPCLLAGAGKRVVFVSSKMGSIADNSSGGSYGYRMSKAAMNMAARTLARDLRRQGIISVAMNPGWVQTDMGGSGAPTTVQESASGILQQIDALTPRDSGEFVDFLGRGRVPW